MITQEYAPGRHVDLHGSIDGRCALLWHGRGVDARTSMAPLARRIGQSGALALTPDWNSESPDGGRADLLMSLRHARDLASDRGHDPDRIIVVGWSLGGTAAVSLAVHAKRLGIRIGGAVLVAPGDGPRVRDPIAGSPLPARLPSAPGPSSTNQSPIDLAYGLHDELATPDLVAGLELRLRSAGWVTRLHSIDADHAGVMGTRFEPATERYVASRSASAIAAADAVAQVVVDAVATSSSS